MLLAISVKGKKKIQLIAIKEHVNQITVRNCWFYIFLEIITLQNSYYVKKQSEMMLPKVLQRHMMKFINTLLLLGMLVIFGSFEDFCLLL